MTAVAKLPAAASKLTSTGTQFHRLHLPLARNRHWQKSHIQFVPTPYNISLLQRAANFLGSLGCICKVRWFCISHPALYLRLEPLNKLVQHFILINICALIQPLQEPHHIISDIPTLLPTAQFLPSCSSIVGGLKYASMVAFNLGQPSRAVTPYDAYHEYTNPPSKVTSICSHY